MTIRTLGLALALTAALPASLAAQTTDPQQLAHSVSTLASDLFEGRAPGTIGEERTISYLVGRFQALGLEPGGPDGQWVQSVPLLHTRLGKAERLGVAQGGVTTDWTVGSHVYLSTLQPKDKVAVEAAPLVFVGYGVSAPERGWDDYKGVDLKGKVAVFLINDPDFEATKGEDAFGAFGGRAMTYYGRWTYKFEEAARRGAIGALIVHDTPGAGYGWNVVVSPGGENYDLVRPADKLTSLAVQGWVEGDAAKALFTGASLDLATLRKQARSKAFRPVELTGARFSAAFPVTQEVVQSANVLARIPGTKRPDETVMYGAHWDAYGKGAPDAQGRIYRAGANDDALGIAGLLEIARAFKAGPAPDRSVLFAAWTAEERGLLGSEHYAQNPVWPLDSTVANLTLDILQTAGKAKDVILVGKGQSTLEDDLAKVAAAQGRVVTQESLPERGLFYRADHFSMAKQGVPVLLLMGIAGASDLVEGGRAAGQAWVDAYTGQCYHQACDAIGPDWKLDGAAQDVDLLLNIGHDLATSTRWPQWKPGSEFKAVRDKSAAARR
ncbi:M28 family metallopeptidase [Sphingobium sp. RAC03]|uniref:M28 family metallopeptidase n=1 Tax=Sphingobium sp. RAC03 TaxID=1843368 RepID=UPI00083E6D24|nr:M28 family metallopeptidase [Sphingobium sp. RAC03]AOF96243.1 peptidase M20/M25/M40 family protein [Sphingobium sp. RAC03]